MAPDSKLVTAVQRARLIPWSAEHLHNRRLALCIRGLPRTREMISELYQLEKGNYPEICVQYTVSQAPQKELQYILLIQNMQNYYWIDHWLKDPQQYRVYYHHEAPIAGEAVGVPVQPTRAGSHFYIRWGYELADPAIAVELAAQTALESALVLVGNTLDETYLVQQPCAVQPVLDLIDLAPGVKVARDPSAPPRMAQPAVLPGSANPLLSIDIGLYGVHQREEIPLYKINALENLISELQFQATLLKTKQTFHACELFAYEETSSRPGSPSSINELQSFLLNTPLADLRKYHYQRIELTLENAQHTYHLLAPASEDHDGSEDLRYPPNPTCRFYLHPDWRTSRFYLPIDPTTGRRMDFYPSLRHGENIEPGHIEKIQQALLGGHQLAAGERILFWPYTEGASAMRTVYCVVVSGWKPLAPDWNDEQRPDGKAASIWGQVNFKTMHALCLADAQNADELLEPIITRAAPQLEPVERLINTKIAEQFQSLDSDYQQFQQAIAVLREQISVLQAQLLAAQKARLELNEGRERLDKLNNASWDTLYQAVQDIQKDLGKPVMQVLEAAQTASKGGSKQAAHPLLAQLIDEVADQLHHLAVSLRITGKG